MEQLGKLVKPGGWFSVLFYNKQSLIWRHLMMGNFVYTNNSGARLQGNGKTLTPDNPQIPETVENWLAKRVFEIKPERVFGPFYDNMRPHDRERSRFEDILEAESLYGRLKPLPGYGPLYSLSRPNSRNRKTTSSFDHLSILITPQTKPG